MACRLLKKRFFQAKERKKTPTGFKPIVKIREIIGRLNSLIKLTFGSLKWKRKSSKEEITTKTKKIGHQLYELESHKAQKQAMIWSSITFR